MSTRAIGPFTRDEALSAEHRRLTGLCAHLTGSADGAEDLAQEVLLIAWRHEAQLRNPGRRWPWLAGIARNACRAAIRQKARGLATSTHADTAALEQLADGDDLELELERDELARLLDRAMAELPAETRSALVWRYVEDVPRAEVAARLGLSERAVSMRLQRGKLALKRILTTDLQDDAIAHGLVEPDAAGWQETRIWCPLCGTRRFVGRLDTHEGAFELRCPDCYGRTGTYTEYTSTLLFTGVSGYKTAFNRVMRFVKPFHERALAHRIVRCPSCTRGDAAVHLHLPAEKLQEERLARGLHLRCGACDSVMTMRLSNLALYQPAAWDFWREHPRIRLLPERVVEVDGRQTVVLSYESVEGRAGLDVLMFADTYEVMAIHQIPGS